MSAKKLSFFKAWLMVCWIVIVGAAGGIAFQAMRITAKPQTYISLAKLVAGGRMTGGSTGGGPMYQEYLLDFYGTIIETIESSEMRRRALDRVRALHPEVKETEVEVQVSQNKGSAIFNIRAFGLEPKYTRIFLDALLDEFIAFRNQIREQQRNKALTALAEDVVRREKGLAEMQDKLTRFKEKNDITVLAARNNDLTAKLRQLMGERDLAVRILGEIETANGKTADLARILSKAGPASAGESGAGTNARPLTQASLADRLLAGEKVNLGDEYLATERAVRLLEAEKSEPSASASQPDLDQKIARAKSALKFIESELAREAELMKASPERNLKKLDAQIEQTKTEILELGSLIATHEQLVKELDAEKRAYDEILDMVRRFTTNEDMTSDYVTVMERASSAVEDLQEWTMPIVIGGVGGGMAGLVVSLLLAALLHSTSPRQEPNEP